MARYGDGDLAATLRQELLYEDENKLKSEIEKTIEEIENKKR